MNSIFGGKAISVSNRLKHLKRVVKIKRKKNH